ncbi:MAG: hypothetical protein AAFZ52_16165 [Bacteroidota bacterium]
MSYSVTITEDFAKSAKRLSKKYKSLKNDLASLIEELKENPYLGDRISRKVYKIRLAIKSKGRGKSGGARVITYVSVEIENKKEGDTIVTYLLEIYDKSEISNIPKDVVDAYEKAAAKLEEE